MANKNPRLPKNRGYIHNTFSISYSPLLEGLGEALNIRKRNAYQ